MQGLDFAQTTRIKDLSILLVLTNWATWMWTGEYLMHISHLCRLIICLEAMERRAARGTVITNPVQLLIQFYPVIVPTFVSQSKLTVII
jgi:hypothetical protein